MPPVTSHPASAPLKNASSNSDASFLAAAAASGVRPTAFSCAALVSVVVVVVVVAVVVIVIVVAVAVVFVSVVGSVGKAGAVPSLAARFTAAVDEEIVSSASAERLKPWISTHCIGGQALRPSHCCPDSCPIPKRSKASTEMG